MQQAFGAIRIHAADNTATMLADGKAGDTVRIDGLAGGVALACDAAFGHKIALAPIAKGEPVLKYGEVIGAASEDIAPGAWVHVHNMESLRGRGDL